MHNHPQRRMPLRHSYQAYAQRYFKIAVPWALGTVSIASAGIVDGYFVGNFVGEQALAAVMQSVPLIILFFAVEVMFGVGGSVRAGAWMGKGDDRQASVTFSASLIVAWCVRIGMALCALYFMEEVGALLSRGESTQSFVITYLQVSCLFYLLAPGVFSISYFLPLDGSERLASFAMMMGSVFNIVFDIAFIYWLEWGMAGAALGTGLSMVGSVGIMLLHWRKPKHRLRWIRPQFAEYQQALRSSINGLSESINLLSMGVIMFVVNFILQREFGVSGVAAYAALSYMMYLQTEVIYALGDSMQPLQSKGFGAGQPRRMRAYLWITYITSFSLGFLFFLAAFGWPQTVIGVFLTDPQAESWRIAEAGLVAVAFFFLINCVKIVATAYLTAIHKAGLSLLIAIFCNLAIPLSLYFILVAWFGGIALFYAIPLAELVSMPLVLWLLLRNKPSPQLRFSGHG